VFMKRGIMTRGNRKKKRQKRKINKRYRLHKIDAVDYASALDHLRSIKGEGVNNGSKKT